MMIVFMRSCVFVALILALIHSTNGFNIGSKPPSRINLRRGEALSPLCMTKESYDKEEIVSVEKAALKKMRENIEAGEFSKAFTILKRNPMMTIEMEDARMLLNNVNELIDWEKEKSGADPNGMITMDYQEYEKKMTEGSTFIYKRLARQDLARGFGCLNDEWPIAATTDVKPSVILDKTGLEMTALTPQSRALVWQLAGLVVFFGEFELGEKLGIDPLITLIPLSLILFLVDQVFYKGAGFESIYQMFFPQYREKIIRHEAGHFLLAYLAGIPVRACVTNARDAQKFPEINGAAGTVFYDTKLQSEMEQEKVTRTSINRMSVVLMAGIAAEAIEYNKAEGGATDERALIQFLTTIQPPWNILRVQGQARWAVLQAVLLIREHEQAYEALVDALKAGKGVGDCVDAIERNLPLELPAAQRLSERVTRETRADMNAIFNYVRKQTFKVGGIEKSAKGKDETRLSLEVAMQGSSSSSSSYAGGAASVSAATLEEAKALKDEMRRSGLPDSTLARAAGAEDDAGSDTDTNTNTDTDSDDDGGLSPEVLLDKFSKKISELEGMAQTGELELTDEIGSDNTRGATTPRNGRSWGKRPPGGGLWLNDLTALKETSPLDASQMVQPSDEEEEKGEEEEEEGAGGDGGSEMPATDTVLDISAPSLPFKKINMPAPLPDYQSRLASLRQQEEEEEEASKDNDAKVRDELVSMGWVVEDAPPAAVLEMAQQQELDMMLPPNPSQDEDEGEGEGEGENGLTHTLSMMSSHRGYLLKEVENAANKASARKEQIAQRLQEIARENRNSVGSNKK